MEKTFITIEQIDNGFLVNANQTNDGEQQQARFCVASPQQLLAVLANALIPQPVPEEVPVETQAQGEIAWPEAEQGPEGADD